MTSTAEGDRLVGSTRPWRVAALAVLAVGAGGLLLGFAGVVPFGLGLVALGASVPILMVIDIAERRRLEETFRGLVWEATWAAASGGLLDAPHEGRTWVFVGEGRLVHRRQARPSTLLIAFDEVAFVVVARNAMLTPLRRRIVRRGEPADFTVQVSSHGGCVLEERLGGTRALLKSGSTGRPAVAEASVDRCADVAERVRRALATAGWI